MCVNYKNNNTAVVVQEKKYSYRLVCTKEQLCNPEWIIHGIVTGVIIVVWLAHSYLSRHTHYTPPFFTSLRFQGTCS